MLAIRYCFGFTSLQVTTSTFLFEHLERSELFLLAPALTEETPANSPGEGHHCNICLCDVP